MNQAFAAVLGVLLLALAACGQGSGPTATSPAESGPQPTSAATLTTPPTTAPTVNPTPQMTQEAPQSAGLFDFVLEGIGGPDPLKELPGFVIDATILRSATGEGPQPNFEPDAPFTISTLLSYDVRGDNLRLDYVREGQAAAKYSEIIAGNLGYMVGSDQRFGGGDGSDIASDRLASSRKQQRLLNPHLLLREALNDPSLVSDGGAQELDGVEHRLLIIRDGVSPITLFVNPDTGMISKLETWENDHWLRDVTLEVFYNDWQPAGAGLRFPNEVSIALEGATIHTETRHSVRIEDSPAAGLFEFPEGANPSFDAGLAAMGEKTSQSLQLFSARGFPQPVRQTSIDAQEVAPGVFHLGGSSHNSLVIEQENGIVIAEAPLYPERSEAVIAWVEARFPDKPITHVISSHHHRDHSSGLRAYVARGVTVVMGEPAEGIFREIFARPSTILPDALAENPAEPVIEAVPTGGTWEIPDPERPVTVVSIAPAHAADTVFTYVGGSGVVFMGDGNSQTPELIAALEKLGLSAATFAGGHGPAAPFE